MVRLVFLGTSAGVPTRQRNVTGLAMQLVEAGAWILTDCGDGVQRQLLKSPCSFAKITHILITHMHGDHVLGLPALLASRSMGGTGSDVTLIGPQGLADFVHAALKATASHLGFKLIIHEWPLDASSWSAPELIEGYKLSAVSCHHGVPSCAYVWEEDKPKRPFLSSKADALGIKSGADRGRLMRGEAVTGADGRMVARDDVLGDVVAPVRFVIGGDNGRPEYLKPYLRGAQFMVHEATYLDVDRERVHDKRGGAALWHSSAHSLAELAEEVGLPCLVMTHISARYHHEEGLAKLRHEAASVYSGRLFLADDFAEYRLASSLQTLEEQKPRDRYSTR